MTTDPHGLSSEELICTLIGKSFVSAACAVDRNATRAKPTAKAEVRMDRFMSDFSLLYAIAPPRRAFGTDLTLRSARYTENDVPHPHERAEFGLRKRNPWRISVSS